MDDHPTAAETFEVAASPTSVAVMTGIPVVAAAAAAVGWLLTTGVLPDPGPKSRTQLMYALGAAACTLLAAATTVVGLRAWRARHRLVVATPERLSIATARGVVVIPASEIRTIGQSDGSGSLIVVDTSGRRSRLLLSPRDDSWPSVARRLRQLYQQ